MPRLRGRELETAEQAIGQSKPRLMKSVGKAKESLDPALVEPTDKPVDKDWADMMTFNKQKVTFVINESTDTNADNPVICGNSGEPKQFWRGVEYTEERRFLESLARAKPTSFTQKLVVDPNGIKSYVHMPHTAGRYDIRVIHDPHPRGLDWLKSILAQPA